MKALLLAVLLPTFLSVIYFGLWASPMYIAEARFAVRGAESSGAAGGLAAHCGRIHPVPGHHGGH